MLLKLYLSFFKIGMLAFGGGLASISLIQNEIVFNRGWITLSEFADLVTIAEMTPGPVAINAATFVGQKTVGFYGGIIASLGCITPSCFIVSFLAYFYFKYKNMKMFKGMLLGLRPGIVAMILSAGVTILNLAVFGENGYIFGSLNINYVSFIVFLFSLFALRKYKVSPIMIIVISGVIGGVINLI